jgi:hypothetical protein
MKKTLPRRIPKYLHRFFWDVDVKKLNPQKYPYFVIARLLDKGDLKSIGWVRKNFPEEIIKNTLENYRDFSLRSANFWSLIYQVPLNKIKCFQTPYYQTRKKLWPY